MFQQEEYLLCGLMSGTSLDGLDIANCRFRFRSGTWEYDIHSAMTLEYNSKLRKKLSIAHTLDPEALLLLDLEFGYFCGRAVKQYSEAQNFVPQYIASHGHTVFHNPEKGFTLQIGNGQAIALSSGIDTICDFRSQDILLGGQGAPLVPVGDKHLFSAYNPCLNIGGFSNISFIVNGQSYAWDVVPANTVLNHLAEESGFPYDKNGETAAAGRIIHELLYRLENLDFYRQTGPKSL